MLAQEICVEQYLYWQHLGWTHREMLTAVERTYVIGMTGDEIVAELISVWQGLSRIGTR